MPSHSRRERDNDTSSESTVENGTRNEAAVENSTRNNVPWYASLWSGWFGSSTDTATVEAEVAVQPSNAEVEVAIEAARDDNANSEIESEMLLAAETELSADQAYVLEEDMHVTAQEGGDKITLADGTTYTVTAADMEGYGDKWRDIARNHGTTADKLAAFNEGVELAVGAQIYMPSPEERLFAEYRSRYGFEEAVTEYHKAAEGPSVAVYTAASERASGRTGESYGTGGIDGGKFMTPNSSIAGASSRAGRSEEIAGQTEYKVFWIKDFWKCSIFMNDAVFQGGYKPAQTANNHYSVAGRAHQARTYTQVERKDARPGDAWQRFGGTGSDESHNAILSSFVEVEKNEHNPDVETWVFKIIGAESDRAAEKECRYDMKAGTNEKTDGRIVRFLRPNTKQ